MDFTKKYLYAIEKKHQDYFNSKNLKIKDCVTITGSWLQSAHIIFKDLPIEIRRDIESMFWVG